MAFDTDRENWMLQNQVISGSPAAESMSVEMDVPVVEHDETLSTRRLY